MVIRKLAEAQTIHDLYSNTSLGLHPYKDHFAVKVTHSYRLELEIELDEEFMRITVSCLILRFTKHYVD